MKITNLRELFENGLKYAYDCEQKLAEKGIPSMIEAASSPELRNALQQHLQETTNHVKRIEKVFNIIGIEAETEDNDIIDEITDVADKMVDATEEGSPLRDAALIVGGNLVEHYEMAAYGSLAAFAKQLGFNEAAQLLEQTLNEEKAADEKLSRLAGSINAAATEESD